MNGSSFSSPFTGRWINNREPQVLHTDLMNFTKDKTPPNPTPNQATRAAAHIAPTEIVSGGITGDSRGGATVESACIDQASGNQA